MGLTIVAVLTLLPAGGSPPTLIKDFASEFVEALQERAQDARHELAQAQMLSFWLWTRDPFYTEAVRFQAKAQAQALKIRAKAAELREQMRKLRALEEEVERSRRDVEERHRQQEPRHKAVTTRSLPRFRTARARVLGRGLGVGEGVASG